MVFAELEYNLVLNFSSQLAADDLSPNNNFFELIYIFLGRDYT